MFKRKTAQIGFVIALLLIFCAPAWAKSDLEKKIAAQGEKESIPLWRQLEALDSADRENAVIRFETLNKKTPAEQKKIEQIENLWNLGSYDPAIEELRLMTQSGNAPGAMGLSWNSPKPMSVPGFGGGGDTKVETRGYAKAVHLENHETTGNLFAIVHFEDGKSPLWTINISKDDGLTWSETFCWYAHSSFKLRDLSITTLDDYIFIGFVAEDWVDDFELARVCRCFAIDGAIDSTFQWKEVFDKDKEIMEIAITGCVFNNGTLDMLYYLAVLKDNSLISYFSVDLGEHWQEELTGINDALGGLDAILFEASPNHLAVSYIDKTTISVRVALKSNSAWISNVVGVSAMPGTQPHTAISAYEDDIIVVYCSDIGGSVRYSASKNNGLVWTDGVIAKAEKPVLFYSSPDVTARKGDGISMIYQGEMGEPDICLFTHCDYGVYNWSPPEPFAEIDVVTGTSMSVEWIPSLSGSPDYGMLWISDDAKKYTYFDRIDTLDGPLAVDCHTLSAMLGGTINFNLDAGGTHANRTYLILGSITGTEPGITLPGGLSTIPVNWDLFTNIMIPLINSPVFNKFFGPLDAYGQGSAQLKTGAVPASAAGLRMYFAFCTNSPFDYVSNPEEIRLLP